jgi:hypothetical protein
MGISMSRRRTDSMSTSTRKLGISVRCLAICAFILALTLSCANGSGGGSNNDNKSVDVRITWDAVMKNMDGSDIHDLSGYRVFWSQTSFKRSGSYLSLAAMQGDSSIKHQDAGADETEATLSLTPGTYYLRLVAFDTSGHYSALNLDASDQDTELVTTVAGN